MIICYNKKYDKEWKKMKIVKLSASQFDKFAETHRYRNYFQSSMYANVMVKFGYHTKFIGFVNDQNNLIGATLIIYKTRLYDSKNISIYSNNN